MIIIIIPQAGIIMLYNRSLRSHRCNNVPAQNYVMLIIGSTRHNQSLTSQQQHLTNTTLPISSQEVLQYNQPHLVINPNEEWFHHHLRDDLESEFLSLISGNSIECDGQSVESIFMLLKCMIACTCRSLQLLQHVVHKSPPRAILSPRVPLG